MRGIGNILGLLVVALVALLVYKFYFSSSTAPGAGTATPMQTIDVVGVKNDLLSIGQAERVYMAQHGSYASLDELTSSGALTMAKTGRDGYTYEVQTTSSDFKAIAHCPASTPPGCKDFTVDSSMEVQQAP
ncbi:MAG TPA: hypothetical protein VJR23_15620 [Candidatus Acidoferrales bacterium]|nr:hypothetical protein [Candidatus Acidoferrales bacterium]